MRNFSFGWLGTSLLVMSLLLCKCSSEIHIPEDALSVSKLLDYPVYASEVEIFGEVSLLGELFCPCFKLTSEGGEILVWYDLMIENDGTQRSTASVDHIRNGDWVLVTGELINAGIYRSDNDFWASEIQPLK